MIQLTYEPAFDAFHTVYRILRLRPIIAEFGPLHRDHVRIIDFYQLFSHRIEGIRLKPSHRAYRRLAKTYEGRKPYGQQPDDRLLFNRMGPLQVTALDTLAAQELLDPESWRRNEALATKKPVPEALAERIDEANEADEQLVSFLRILSSEYELTGPDGLKARSGLMEHRHDAV